MIDGKVNRFTLNDHLCDFLLRQANWTPHTDEDYDRLNDLTHDVGDKIDLFLEHESAPDPDRMEV